MNTVKRLIAGLLLTSTSMLGIFAGPYKDMTWDDFGLETQLVVQISLWKDAVEQPVDPKKHYDSPWLHKQVQKMHSKVVSFCCDFRGEKTSDDYQQALQMRHKLCLMRIELAKNLHPGMLAHAKLVLAAEEHYLEQEVVQEVKEIEVEPRWSDYAPDDVDPEAFGFDLVLDDVLEDIYAADEEERSQERDDDLTIVTVAFDQGLAKQVVVVPVESLEAVGPEQSTRSEDKEDEPRWDDFVLDDVDLEALGSGLVPDYVLEDIDAADEAEREQERDDDLTIVTFAPEQGLAKQVVVVPVESLEALKPEQSTRSADANRFVENLMDEVKKFFIEFKNTDDEPSQ